MFVCNFYINFYLSLIKIDEYNNNNKIFDVKIINCQLNEINFVSIVMNKRNFI